MLKTLVWEPAAVAGGIEEAGPGSFRELSDPSQLAGLLDDGQRLLWLDLTSPRPEELAQIAREFALHPLAVEDAIKQSQRPKIEEYDNFYFMVVFAIRLEPAAEPAAGLIEDSGSVPAADPLGWRVVTQEVDLFIGQRFLITVHAAPLPLLEEMLDRWRRNRRAIHEGIGVLVYTLLDSIVDGYFPVLDEIIERVEDLEETLFIAAPVEGNRQVQRLFQIKRSLLQLRRVIAPERDALLILVRQEVPLFDRKVAIYFQDVYDHVVRVTDAIDVYQDLLTNALESYLSLVSNNLNQVMKVLTALTVIVAVPAVIAAIYGMNFDLMPELHWRYGYPFALGLMLAAMGLLFLYFRRKGWI